MRGPSAQSVSNILFFSNSDSVILGEYDERTDPDCDGDFCAEPIQQIKAVRVAHPTFDRRLIANDIMLVKLEKPAKFNGEH